MTADPSATRPHCSDVPAGDGMSGGSGVSVERRLVHQGPRFALEVVTERLPGGAVVEKEVVRHPGAVIIVPVIDDDVVMIRNTRAAVGETLLEFPAGTLEPPEPPDVCASRELIEETGYEGATIRSLGWFYTTPGLTDERMHAFVATGLRHVGQRLEAGERITVERVPVSDLFDRVDRAELIDAKSIVALLLASRRDLLPGGAPGGGEA